MNPRSRIIHRVIERLNNRIERLILIRTKLQAMADRYDEQDQEPEIKVPES
jgi:hypothetical protein